jgi:enoyl-CoA hydratase/carnithine racemase
MPVTYELDQGVAVITFDDGKANVYSHEALGSLTEALDRADADPGARAVVIAGRPGRFSAGFDLPTMTASAESMRSLVKAGAQFVTRVLLEPLPVVAACTGHALAAGALVLLGADHRVGAGGEWKIGLNEVSIGMPLPLWAVELARYRLAPTHFEWRVVLGQVGGPEEAVDAGFLDRVVTADAVVGEATATAATLAGLRTGAVSGTKSRARQELVRRMMEGIDADLGTLSVPEP